MTTESSVSLERRQQVQDALADIRGLLAAAPLSRDLLARITTRLEQLAQQRALFPAAEFAPPAPGQGVGASTRYRLNARRSPPANRRST